MGAAQHGSLVTLDGVTFRYPKSVAEALSSVSLQIPRGSFFALLGPNGAGKTTLLRLLCGRFTKFTGHLDVSVDVASENGFLNPLKCGILLENPGIYQKLSIAEYVDYFVGFYADRIPSWNAEASRERIAALAQKLELPSLDTRMGMLSLGNRQKVQLLRALASNPQVLILDEPVANLDPISRETVWSLIADWRKNEGGTAIVCSHILAEMEEEATDYAIIDRGQVLKSGRVADLETDVNTFKIETSIDVELWRIESVLAAAGISAKVSKSQASLSKIYRETV